MSAANVFSVGNNLSYPISTSQQQDCLSPSGLAYGQNYYNHQSHGCYQPQLNVVHNNTIQTNSLLMELSHWQTNHRLAEQQFVKEETTYCQVRQALSAKIAKYEGQFNRKMDELSRAMPEVLQFDVEESIGQLISLQDKITEMKQTIHKKKWYTDRNEFYRKLVEQQLLRENIDGLTQKICYFEHLIMNHVANNDPNNENKKRLVPRRLSPMNENGSNTVSIVTPFVVKEALRIKAENEKEILQLRDRLDTLRKSRQ